MTHANSPESSRQTGEDSVGSAPRPQPAAGSGGDTSPLAATSPDVTPLSGAQPLGPADPSGQPGSSESRRGAPASDTAELPEQFGRYRILKKLGQGGMGAVYQAYDSQLERTIALKIPKLSASDGPQVIERFYREARSAATLRHPNICPVYDVGQIEGVHYMTMAFIEGHLLSAYIRPSKPAPERQVAGVVRTLALALQEAHSQGIVHRDLKPTNVILNQRGEPVIMDFGLARRNTADDSHLTQHGTVVGTPAYMSPEQARGQAEGNAPRADIYSLGVILYELLTGQRPFRGATMEVLCQIVSGELQPPSALRPGLDPQLERICLKALARKAEDRYATMTEFAAALSEFLASSKRAEQPAGTSQPVPAEQPAATDPPAPVEQPAARRWTVPQPRPKSAAAEAVFQAGTAPRDAASPAADLAPAWTPPPDAVSPTATAAAQTSVPPVRSLRPGGTPRNAGSRWKIIAVAGVASVLGLMLIGAGTAAVLLLRPAPRGSVGARQGAAALAALPAANQAGAGHEQPGANSDPAADSQASSAPPAESGAQPAAPKVEPKPEPAPVPKPDGSVPENMAAKEHATTPTAEPPAGATPAPEPSAPSAAAGNADPQPPPQRVAVPSDAAQAQVAAQIKNLYHPEQAATVAAKTELARKLCDLAAQSTGNPQERFVLLRQAAELACDAGEVDLLLETLDTLAAGFEVATPNLHAQMLQRVLGSEDTPARVVAFLKGSEGVIERALAADNYELALKISETAKRLAERPIGKKEFRQEIRDRHARTEWLFQQHQRVQQALTALHSDPASGAAHLALGRWYCFAKGDWEQGLPHLSASSDARLQAIAKQEPAAATGEASAKQALAEAWWEIAQNAVDYEKAAILRHADGWYEQAYQGQLSALAKATVEQRRGEIADLLAKLDPADLARDAAAAGRRGAADPSIEGSSNLRALFERGLAAGLKDNNFTLAQSLFGRCAKLDPHHVPTLNNLALNSVRLGNYRQALLLWKTACETAPSQAAIQHNLGRLLELAKAGQLRLDHALLDSLEGLHADPGASAAAPPSSPRSRRPARSQPAAWIYLPFEGSAGYEDFRCLACSGNKQVKCPATGCARGAVSKQSLAPVARTPTGGVITQTKTVRVPCTVCRGQGFVPCPTCHGKGS